MSESDRLLVLLAAVDHADESRQPVTNERLVAALGWSAEEVAGYLETAQTQMLIWGLRNGGLPKPHFEDVELTVQGQRLLRSNRPPSNRSSAIADSEATS
jgi:hypothetical protein